MPTAQGGTPRGTSLRRRAFQGEQTRYVKMSKGRALGEGSLWLVLAGPWGGRDQLLEDPESWLRILASSWGVMEGF